MAEAALPVPPPEIEIGSTPLFLKKPATLTFNHAPSTFSRIDLRAQTNIDAEHLPSGLENAVILVNNPTPDADHPGPYKVLRSINPNEKFAWDSMYGVMITDDEGNTHIFEQKDLSLTPPTPEPVTPEPPPGPASEPPTPPALTELQQRARKPEAISVVGVNTKGMVSERAAKQTQKITAESGFFGKIFKGNVFHELIEEHQRQFTERLSREMHAMASDETFDLIATRAKQQYDTDMAALKKDHTFRWRWTKFKDSLASSFGGYTTQETNAIAIAGDMYATGELGRIDSTIAESARAIQRRFETDFVDQEGAIRANLGEHITVVKAGSPEHQQLMGELMGIRADYLDGRIQDKELAERLDVFGKTHVGEGADQYTSSLTTLIRNDKAQLTDGVDRTILDAQLTKMDIRLGMAQMGEATQFQTSGAERVVTWMASKNLIGTLFTNEASAGTAAAVALSLGYLPRYVASRAARLGLGAAGGGAVAGTIAGLKENARMKREFFTYMRERESGGGLPTPNDKLRTWMAGREIPQVEASELMSRMVDLAYDHGTLKANLSDEELTKTLAYLADAKARRAISARGGENISLIRWGPAVDVARTNLDLSIDKLERDLMVRYPNAQTNFGGQTVRDYIKLLTTTQTNVLTQGRAAVSDPLVTALGAADDHDIVVQKFRRKLLIYGKATAKGEAQGLDAALAEVKKEIRLEAVRRGVNTAVIGTSIGTVLSQGAYELTHPGHILATAEHILHIPVGHAGIETPVPGQYTDVPAIPHITDAQGVDHAVQAVLPEHTSLVVDTAHHTWNLVDAHHHILQHDILIDQNGQITNADALNTSQDAVSHHLHFENTPYTISGEGPSGTIDFHVADWDQRGFWGVVEDKLGGQTFEYHNAATNAVKHALRGYELHFAADPATQHVNNIDVVPPPGYVQNVQYHDTIWGHEVYYNTLPSGATLHLPSSLFSDHSMITLGHAADDAARQYNDALAHGLTGEQALAGMDRLHQIAWKIGYSGMEKDIPTREELQYLMDNLGGGTRDIYTGVITQTVGAGVVPAAEQILTEVPAVVPLPREGMKPGKTTSVSPGPGRFTPYGPSIYGYESGAGRNIEYYQSRWSPTIKENPLAQLNAPEEMDRYLQSLTQSERETLEALNAGLPTAENECRVFCAVPVYDLGEGKVILRALEQYKLQISQTNKNAVNAKEFEVILYLNHPKFARERLETRLGHPLMEGSQQRAAAYIDNPEHNPIEPYDTRAVIEEFQRRNPELNIRIVAKEYPAETEAEKPKWGEIIKPLYDLALFRAKTRTSPISADPLIVTNDADAVRYAPWYIKEIIRYADTYPDADAYIGRYDWATESYKENATFHVASRFETFVSSMLRRYRANSRTSGYTGPIHTPGPNTILRGSIYAAIGGVNESTDVGADGELGRMIYFARGQHVTVDYAHKIYTDMDPRRAIESFNKGIPLVGTWSSWGDLSFYGKGFEQRLGSLTPSTVVDKDRLQNEINGFVSVYGLNIHSPELARVFSWLGLRESDYQIVDNKLQINDISGVQKNIDEYQNKHVYEFHKRSNERAKKGLEAQDQIPPPPPETKPATIDMPNKEAFTRGIATMQDLAVKEVEAMQEIPSVVRDDVAYASNPKPMGDAIADVLTAIPGVEVSPEDKDSISSGINLLVNRTSVRAFGKKDTTDGLVEVTIVFPSKSDDKTTIQLTRMIDGKQNDATMEFDKDGTYAGGLTEPLLATAKYPKPQEPSPTPPNLTPPEETAAPVTSKPVESTPPSAPPPTESEEELSRKFWTPDRPRSQQTFLAGIIKDAYDKDKSISLLVGLTHAPDGSLQLDEASRIRFAAYRVLARENGYEIGDPTMHEDSSNITAAITKTTPPPSGGTVTGEKPVEPVAPDPRIARLNQTPAVVKPRKPTVSQPQANTQPRSEKSPQRARVRKRTQQGWKKDFQEDGRRPRRRADDEDLGIDLRDEQ